VVALRFASMAGGDQIAKIVVAAAFAGMVGYSHAARSAVASCTSASTAGNEWTAMSAVL
jgi:hypothetical protein